MQIRLEDGYIGFDAEEKTCQFWKAHNSELLDFAEDVMFWANAMMSGAVGFWNCEESVISVDPLIGC